MSFLPRFRARKNGGAYSTRSGVNFIEGSGTTITLTDDPTSDEIDLTIASSAFGVTVKEVDGTPNVSGVTTIRVSNGTLTDDGSGQVSVTTGGGAGSVGLFFPDLPPASPNANDDEFDNGSLGAAWTEFDFGTDLTVTEGDYGVKLANANASGVSIAGIYRSIPASDWSLITKVSLVAVGYTNFFNAGIALLEDGASSTGDITVLMLQADSGGLQLAVVNYSQWDTFSSTSKASGADTISSPWAYLRVRRSGTTYLFDYSKDGIGWLRIHSGTLGFTPTHVGLFCNNQDGAGGTEGAAYFRFWRQTSLTTLDQPLLGNTG